MDSPVMRLPGRFNRQFASRLSVDCYVPLDTTLTIDENIAIVLDNVLAENGVGKARLLGHLNNLVTLLRKNEETTFPIKVLLNALKVLLINESKEIRTAGLRSIRYVIRNKNDLRVFYSNKIDHFVVKCLDIIIENETERVQALKLIRHVIALDPSRVPRIITHSLASSCDSCDDSLRLVCVETVCELVIMNPKAFGDYDVINQLLHNAIDVDQSVELTKMMFGVILHVLNRTDAWTSLDLEYVISPLMEVYFHQPKSGRGPSEEKVANRLKRCRMALNTILYSWTGMSRLCTPSPVGVRSLINLLCISNPRVQTFIMKMFFNQLFGKQPDVSEDFAKTVENFTLEESKHWSLTEGFVAREGYHMLQARGSSTSTFLDHHRSLLLTCLLQTGLCETLVDVATGSTNADIGVMATLLLAEVLDLSQKLIPAMFETVTVCTSALLSNSASDDDLTVKSRARQTVNRLQEHQSIKAKHNDQISLFLQALLYQTKPERPHVHTSNGLEAVEPVLRDFQAMSPRDTRVWDWDIINMVLESAYDLPRNGEDEGHFRFLRRLVHFFKPSSRFYSIIRLDEDYAHSLSVLACQLVVFLLEADNSEAAVILNDFLNDFIECIKIVKLDVVTGDPLLGPARIRSCLSQHYFLIIGHLTHYADGETFLEDSGLTELLLQLFSITKHSEYVKLVISALNYRSSPVGKTVLCKALTSSCEEGRIYSTHFLSLLMKMKIPGVNGWGMNLLVAQLLDQSLKVAEEALKTLENLCEDEELLENVVSTLPPLMHLSEKGIFLLAKLMSIPSGFKMFGDAKVLGPELKRWKDRMNVEYVFVDEKHREDIIMNANSFKLQSYPLVHLYGQLVQHEEGFDLVTRQDCISDYIQCLRSASTMNSNCDVLQLKTSLWVLGHLGSSASGAEWLEQEGVLSMILTLSTCSPNLTVRATAFCAVNLVAKTDKGRLLVERYGWTSLLHEKMRSTSRASSSFSSSSGSFSNPDIFPDSFRKPLFTVSSCPEVHEGDVVELKRERGQSDSVVMTHSHTAAVPRSATVSTCSTSTRTSNSEPSNSAAHDRTVSEANSTVSWPRSGKSATVNSEPGGVFRPYNRSLSATVGSYDANFEQEKCAKLYLLDKISGKKLPSRGLCVPVPVWNLFKADVVKREFETVLEDAPVEQSEEGVDHEVIRRIHQMCGIRGQKTAENDLLKMKQKSPEIFQDQNLYERICGILNDYFFSQTARRFIQELFLDVKFLSMVEETRELYAEVRPNFAKKEEEITTV